jgi:hypothetical protein
MDGSEVPLITYQSMITLLEPNVSINESSGHKHLHHVCSLRQAKLHPRDWVKFQACIILGFQMKLLHGNAIKDGS